MSGEQEWVVEGHYGCGWEALTHCETEREARAECATYDREEPGNNHRVRRLK